MVRPINEYIAASAIWYDDGIKHSNQPVETGFIVGGHRHHNCLGVLATLIPDWNNHKMLAKEQGFLTSLGRFVDRYEAYAIEYGSNPDNKRLFSEDIFPVGGY